MSKTSLLIGCVLAAALHGLLLLPMSPSDADEVAPDPSPGIRIPGLPTPPPEPKGLLPEPEPPAKAAREHKAPAHAPTPRPPMQRVAPAPAPPEPERADPADASAGQDDKALPPMRIAWTSPQQVRAVARALGLRIVAVNAGGQAVGQIDPYGGPMKDFTARLDQYSNRVRTLPRGFFGPGSAEPGDRDVAGFWILVPAAVDRQWIALQRSAIAERGMRAAEVREVEARFTGSDETPRLSITRVHGRRETGRPNQDKET